MHPESASLRIRAVCFALSAAFIWGCDKHGNVPQGEQLPFKPGPQDPATRLPQKKQPTMKTESETFMDLEFGDLHLRIPEKAKPLYIAPPSRHRLSTWTWQWPGLTSAADKGRPPTADELSTLIKFKLAATEQETRTAGNVPRQQTDVRGIDVNAEIGKLARRFAGPFVNGELKLLEYRRADTSPVGMFYTAEDNSIVTASGIAMFAECAETATPLWGGYRGCVAGGSLSPLVGYSYEFSDRLLPHWRQINAAITDFIKTITVENQ